MLKFPHFSEKHFGWNKKENYIFVSNIHLNVYEEHGTLSNFPSDFYIELLKRKACYKKFHVKVVEN